MNETQKTLLGMVFDGVVQDLQRSYDPSLSNLNTPLYCMNGVAVCRKDDTSWKISTEAAINDPIAMRISQGPIELLNDHTEGDLLEILRLGAENASDSELQRLIYAAVSGNEIFIRRPVTTLDDLSL